MDLAVDGCPAHLLIDHTEEAALAKLDAQFAAHFHSADFRTAEAEGRKPVYEGFREAVE
jgi:hypothetical protein